jgi:hypothetical protein
MNAGDRPRMWTSDYRRTMLRLGTLSQAAIALLGEVDLQAFIERTESTGAAPNPALWLKGPEANQAWMDLARAAQAFVRVAREANPRIHVGISQAQQRKARH